MSKEIESLETTIATNPVIEKPKLKKKFRISFEEYKSFLQDLMKIFPACFSKDHPRPLKIGIHKDLQSALREKSYLIGSNKINGFMRLYCTRREYIASHKMGEARIDLDGVIVGEVTKDQAEEVLRISPKPKYKTENKRKPV